MSFRRRITIVSAAAVAVAVVLASLLTYFLTSDQLHRQVDTQLHNRGREAGRLVKFLRSGGTPAPATSTLDLGDVSTLTSGASDTTSTGAATSAAGTGTTAAATAGGKVRHRRISNTTRGARNLFGHLPPNPDQVRGYQQVVDAHGKILARSAQNVSLPADAQTRALAAHGGAAFLRDTRLHSVHLRVLAEPFGSG